MVWLDDEIVMWSIRSELGLLYHDTTNSNKMILFHDQTYVLMLCSFTQIDAQNKLVEDREKLNSINSVGSEQTAATSHGVRIQIYCHEQPDEKPAHYHNQHIQS